jgi:DNA-binding NarL/FixJ family response regulator
MEAMTTVETVETVGRKMMEDLRKATGAKGDGYILWGVTPEELIASLESLAKEVRELAPYLPAYRAQIRKKRYTLMAMLLDGKTAYASGAKVPIRVLPWAKA